MTAESTTSRALLLDLNKQITDMRGDMGKLLEGLANVQEKQKSVGQEMTSIYERLDAGSRRHAEFSQSLAIIDLKLEPLASVPADLIEAKQKLDGMFVEGGLYDDVKKMKPDVKELMDFKARIAAQTVVASAIVGSALWFVWEGVKWFFPHPKELFDRLFY